MSFYPSPRPMTLGLIPSGPAGIKATLDIMVQLAREARKDPSIRQLAAQLVANLPQADKLAEVRALHAFVRDSIRYTNDPVDLELLQTPRATLEMGVGDCDDKSTLLAALLRAVGRPARFIAVALNGSKDYSHVLVQTRAGNGWISLETIKPVQVGWSPKGVNKVMVANV